MPFEIHSVDFRQNYTTPQAKRWLKKHNLQPIKRVHITKKDGVITSRRYRIKDPALFKTFITKKIDGGNINLILGQSEGQEGAGLIQNIKDFISGRPAGMYPPSIRKFIEQHGNATIENVSALRVPLSGAISKAGNILTLGGMQRKINELNIDKLRHLYVVIRVSGNNYLLEKNETIVIKPDIRRPNEQVINFGRPTNNITVSELFNKLIEEDPNINIYDAFTANCSLFAEHVLKILGVWNNAAASFVQQNVKDLVPTTHKRIARGVTNLAARFDVLLHGKGRNKHSVLCRKHN
jgi:hypothetical protein